MDGIDIFKFCAAIVVGLCIGSYLAALSWRLPRGVKSLRSACPACGHTLAPRDLVPVLSWLALRGRCRYCNASIGARYTVIELATAAVFAGLYLVFEN